MDAVMLKGMTKAQLEEARALIERELLSCAFCGSEGAERYSCRRSTRSKSPGHQQGVLQVCVACWEKHRLPKWGEKS